MLFNLFLDALFEVLEPRRVERSVVRSVAKYEGGKIVVTRKKKIWNNIGYLKDNIQFLHEHEALYLIEMVTRLFKIVLIKICVFFQTESLRTLLELCYCVARTILSVITQQEHLSGGIFCLCGANENGIYCRTV